MRRRCTGRRPSGRSASAGNSFTMPATIRGPYSTGSAIQAQRRTLPKAVGRRIDFWPRCRRRICVPVSQRFPPCPLSPCAWAAKPSRGAFPFYEAATVGGPDNLRGFREDRFAGESALYGNGEFPGAADSTPGSRLRVNLAHSLPWMRGGYSTTPTRRRPTAGTLALAAGFGSRFSSTGRR